MEILKEIVNRFSVKNFLKKDVEMDKIMSILEAGRLAPSAKNRQSWRFVVVTREKIKKHIEECCFEQEFVSHAGAIIALCTTNINYKMPNDQLSYPIDLGMASAFMMLQATKEGLGSCPIGIFKEEKLAKVLTVPYSMRVVLLVLIGYDGESERRTRDRLPLEKIISFEHW